MTTKMTTDKQKAANQANAKKSTGPKTEEGKAKSSMNPLKHGLLAKRPFMTEEEQEEFEALWAMLREEFQPAGGYDEMHVFDLADLFWRQRKCPQMEGEILIYARCAIDYETARSEATDTECQVLGLDDPLNASDLSSKCEDLKFMARLAKKECQGAEDSDGGAFLHTLKMGDPLSKLARHETRIRNEIRRIVAELQERQKTSYKRLANLNDGWQSLDGTPAFPDAFEDDDDDEPAEEV